MTDDRLLTADEVGEILGLRPQSIRRGCVPGLEAVRVGRRALRWRASDVQAVVEGRTPTPSDASGASPPNTDERTRLAQALGTALVRLLVEENLLPINEVNDRLIPALNKRWTAIVENWDRTDDEDEHEHEEE